LKRSTFPLKWGLKRRRKRRLRRNRQMVRRTRKVKRVKRNQLRKRRRRNLLTEIWRVKSSFALPRKLRGSERSWKS
jgi:hypothetical protein